jgi:hypothetical protein
MKESGSGASVWDQLRKPQPAEPGEPKRGGPREADDLGPCASRPLPGGWTGIYILGGAEDTHAFDYIHTGHKLFAADRRSFFVEFNVRVGERWRLTVFGRNLWPIFLNLHHHKLEWIKKADRDFADDTTPIITDIRVEPIEEEQ